MCVSSPDQRRPPQVWEHRRVSGHHSTPSNAGSGQRVLNYGSGGKFKKLESYIAVGVLLAPWTNLVPQVQYKADIMKSREKQSWMINCTKVGGKLSVVYSWDHSLIYIHDTSTSHVSASTAFIIQGLWIICSSSSWHVYDTHRQIITQWSAIFQMTFKWNLYLSLGIIIPVCVWLRPIREKRGWSTAMVDKSVKDPDM